MGLDPVTEEILLFEDILKKRTIRKSLVAWAQHCGFEPALHHRYIIDKLEKVARGEIPKLMIFVPPSSAKSTYASMLFPPWFLAQRPNSNILTCSHSAEMAEHFGRRARNLIIEKGADLAYGLTSDSQAAGKWATTNGGEFFCAGVGGRIAGRRADLGLIDDPVGSKEDAYSKLARDKAWDWYNFDFRTRLKPGAGQVLIQTRWHEDDLAGRLLETERSEWEVISLPYFAVENDVLGRKEGELLWPEFYTPQMVADAKKDPSVFQCLYQQNPIPESGNFFKREWIVDNTYGLGELPEDLRIYAASDHAVSEKQNADLTCLLAVGVDTKGTIWILPDAHWCKCNAEETTEAMVAMMKRRRPIVWWAEAGHISKAIGPFLNKRMREESTYCYVEEVTPARDKTTRAQSIQGRLSMGMVRFPKHASWYGNALSEMLRFPAGKHDDFVDTISHVGMGLDKMTSGSARKVAVEWKEPSLSNFTLRDLKLNDKVRRKRNAFARLDY